jgi:hypothetical protein
MRYLDIPLGGIIQDGDITIRNNYAKIAKLLVIIKVKQQDVQGETS